MKGRALNRFSSGCGGTPRNDEDAPDPAGLFETHQGPGLAGVERFVDARAD
jgi:hypothetical protein